MTHIIEDYSAERTTEILDAYEEMLLKSDARSAVLRDRLDILTEDDFGAMLGLDTRTVVVWRSQKKGPDYVKLGKSCFYRRGDIEKWIDLQVVPCDRA